MKIDINTPQDQLLKYQKSCGTAFGWLLGIGIVTFPVGIVPIGFALYFHSQKKKAAALIAQQQYAPKITPVAGFSIAERYAAERQAALASWDKFLEENAVVREIHTKVAGVTFRNEDGSSRQIGNLPQTWPAICMSCPTTTPSSEKSTRSPADMTDSLMAAIYC